MPRPSNKLMLLDLASTNYQNLRNFIKALPREEQEAEFPVGTMNRCFADVLFHLHEWHLLMLDWYNIGMNGGKPDMPMKAYTWKENSKLNAMLWERNRNRSLEEAFAKLEESHAMVLRLIEKHDEIDLFEKKRYPWTGSTSLAAYLISATSSHYDWALNLSRKVHNKRLKEIANDT